MSALTLSGMHTLRYASPQSVELVVTPDDDGLSQGEREHYAELYRQRHCHVTSEELQAARSALEATERPAK